MSKPRTTRPRPAAAAPTGLRDALSRKVRPSRTYRLPVADPTPAREALQAADSLLKTAHLLKDDERVAAAETALAEARDAFEACWQPITLWAIGGRLSDLIAEHPPTDEQAADGAEWDPDTFRPALIAAAATDVGMTAEEWAAELADPRWSVAERNELFSLALEPNITSTQDQYRLRAAGTDPLGSLRSLLPAD